MNLGQGAREGLIQEAVNIVHDRLFRMPSLERNALFEEAERKLLNPHNEKSPDLLAAAMLLQMAGGRT